MRSPGRAWPACLHVLVAGNLGVAVQDPDRDRVVGGREPPRGVDVERIVLAVIRVDPREVRSEMETVLVRQEQCLRRILQPRIEYPRHELGAPLDDPDEREAAVPVRGGDDVVEHLRDPVNRLGDERNAFPPRA